MIGSASRPRRSSKIGWIPCGPNGLQRTAAAQIITTNRGARSAEITYAAVALLRDAHREDRADSARPVPAVAGPIPLRRALVGAVIGSKQMNARGGERTPAHTDSPRASSSSIRRSAAAAAKRAGSATASKPSSNSCPRARSAPPDSSSSGPIGIWLASSARCRIAGSSMSQRSRGTPGRDEVGVKAERQRNGVRTARVHGHRYLAGAHRPGVPRSGARGGNGNTSNSSGSASVQLNRAVERLRVRVRARAASSQPSRPPITPCIGRPLSSSATRARSCGTSTVRPATAVLEAGEPVRPGVQQRDAHRLAVLGVGADAGVLGEQLIAAMAQRRADHARRRERTSPRACASSSRRHTVANRTSLTAPGLPAGPRAGSSRPAPPRRPDWERLGLPYTLQRVNLWIPDQAGHDAVGELPEGVSLGLIPARRRAARARSSTRSSSYPAPRDRRVRELLVAMPALRVIQTLSAGVDWLLAFSRGRDAVRRERYARRPGRRMGARGDPRLDARRLPELRDRQREHRWEWRRIPRARGQHRADPRLRRDRRGRRGATRAVRRRG